MSQTSRELLDELRAYKRSRVLAVAISSGLLTAMQRGASTIDEVASECSAAIDWTRSLLRATAALGLSRCENGRWRLTSEGDAACADDVVQAFATYHLFCFEAWMDLPDKIRASGDPGFHRQRIENPAFAKAYLRSMEVIAKRNLPFLREYCPLSGRILDVGAGPSTYCRELATHGRCIVTGLDLPPLVESAKTLFEYPANFTWVGCEFQEYAPSHPFDVVFCSHFLEYCSAKRLPQWLRSLRRFLHPGGTAAFVIFLREGGRDSIDFDLFELSTGLNGAELGHIWTVEEFHQQLVETGASSVRCFPIPNGASYREHLVLANWQPEETGT